MLYKKIVIFLLLSQPSCTLSYAAEGQNNIKSQDPFILRHFSLAYHIFLKIDHCYS